jgi:hypothetical protein
MPVQPVPSLAARPRVRALLRLPRRRDQPVASRPHTRQRADRAARRRLPPERGPAGGRLVAHARGDSADADVETGGRASSTTRTALWCRPSRRRRSRAARTRSRPTSTSPPTARRACSWRRAVTLFFFELERLSRGFRPRGPGSRGLRAVHRDDPARRGRPCRRVDRRRRGRAPEAHGLAVATPWSPSA